MDSVKSYVIGMFTRQYYFYIALIPRAFHVHSPFSLL